MAAATSILLVSHCFTLNPVECMLTKIPRVSPLNATLTNSSPYKSFTFHSYEKTPGGYPPPPTPRLGLPIAFVCPNSCNVAYFCSGTGNTTTNDASHFIVSGAKRCSATGPEFSSTNPSDGNTTQNKVTAFLLPRQRSRSFRERAAACEKFLPSRTTPPPWHPRQETVRVSPRPTLHSTTSCIRAGECSAHPVQDPPQHPSPRLPRVGPARRRAPLRFLPVRENTWNK